MKQIGLIMAFLLVTAHLLATCFDLPMESPTGQPVSCEDLVEDKLTGATFNPMSDDDTNRWVLERYGVSPSSGGSDSRYRSFYWRLGDKYYHMYLRNSGYAVSAMWERNYPALAEILRCVGEPEYYSASLDPTPGPTFTQLALQYPHKGLSFQITLYEPVQKFETTAPVFGVSYFKQGSLEEMILATAIVEPGSDAYQRILDAVKPWPSSLDQVVIDKPS